MKRSQKFLQNLKKISFVLWIFFLHCTNYLTAPGPQPHFIQAVEYEPRLNVFGVLRPDSSEAGLPLSFIEVESTFLDEYPHDFEQGVEVFVFPCEAGQPTDTIPFFYTNLGVFEDSTFRNPQFFPLAGKTYRLECHKPGYPTLTGQTTIPDVPHVIENSLHVSAEQIQFSLKRDEKVGLYEIVLLGECEVPSKRILPTHSEEIPVSIRISRRCSFSWILIYAYDLHLAEYLTTNISLKPNVYQPSFSTVENGYGCFGSLNVLKVRL